MFLCLGAHVEGDLRVALQNVSPRTSRVARSLATEGLVRACDGHRLELLVWHEEDSPGEATVATRSGISPNPSAITG